MSGIPDDQRARLDRLARRHERIGWYGLALFLGLGLLLESMHGLKVGFYLENPIRREQWTLAHAHGTLVAVIHLIFGIAVRDRIRRSLKQLTLVSRLLNLAIILLPGGFFLGGIGFTETDPGAGIWLVPLGGLLLLIAVLLAAQTVSEPESNPS
jgi:hypothetical protein